MSPPTAVRFTRSDYYLMADAGILKAGSRTELIDGNVLVRSPISPWHSTVVSLLSQAFSPIREWAGQWVQNPIAVDEFNEPEPDFVLVRQPLLRYRKGHPTPADILLAVEVADSSRAFDRRVKLPIYAAAGIREFWLVDLVDERIEVCREPGPEGYGSIRSHHRGESLNLLEFRSFRVPVESILGPEILSEGD